MEVRVVFKTDDNGSYWVVQCGHKVRGRWKTAGGSLLRAEKLFCIEERMLRRDFGSDDANYKEAKRLAKIDAEQYAQGLRTSKTVAIKIERSDKEQKIEQKIRLIRVALDEHGQANFWPYDDNLEDYWEQPLDAKKALHLITKGQVQIEIACNDPQDSQPHHYESHAGRLRRI